MKIRKIVIILIIMSISVLAGCSDNSKQNKEEVKVIEQVKIENVSTDDYKEFYPQEYDIDIAKEKGLISSTIFEEKYVKTRCAYEALFNYWLCENTDLSKYQQMMDDSNLNFLNKADDIYWKCGAFDRNNITIRNNFYIERLTEEQLGILSDAIEGDTLNITDELLLMLENTYENVITVYHDTGAEEPVTEVIYDFDAFSEDSAPNDAIVLSIYYSFEYDENGKLISRENEMDKDDFVRTLSEVMESEIGMATDTSVKVFIKK